MSGPAMAIQQSISHDIWAQTFVRCCREQPGLCLDEAEVAKWFSEAMSVAYAMGLKDGMDLS